MERVPGKNERSVAVSPSELCERREDVLDSGNRLYGRKTPLCRHRGLPGTPVEGTGTPGTKQTSRSTKRISVCRVCSVCSAAGDAKDAKDAIDAKDDWSKRW